MAGWSMMDLGDCCCGVCVVCVGAVCGGTANISGLTVQVLSGATVVFTGTTDATGCVTLTGVGAGSYTVRIYNGATQIFSGTITCPGTNTVTIGTPTNAFCCDGCPVPNTLTLTDGGGTITLTGTGGSWSGSYFMTVIGLTTTGSCPGACVCSTPQAISLKIRYSVTCAGGGQLTVVRTWSEFICANGSVCGYCDWNAACACGAYNPLNPCSFQPYPICYDRQARVTSAWSGCSPFSWSGSPVPDADTPCITCGTGGLGDPVGGAVTITA